MISVVISPKHRRSPRAQVAMPCTLRRPKGSPIAAQTLNVGSGGMLVTCVRPLAIDEQVDFDLATLELPVCGRARVLRQQLHDVYALRFDDLPGEMQRCLHVLALGDQPAPD
jgi:hypothetical protein